jgi:hypothetical protein
MSDNKVYLEYSNTTDIMAAYLLVKEILKKSDNRILTFKPGVNIPCLLIPADVEYNNRFHNEYVYTVNLFEKICEHLEEFEISDLKKYMAHKRLEQHEYSGNSPSYSILDLIKRESTSSQMFENNSKLVHASPCYISLWDEKNDKFVSPQKNKTFNMVFKHKQQFHTHNIDMKQDDVYKFDTDTGECIINNLSSREAFFNKYSIYFEIINRYISRMEDTNSLSTDNQAGVARELYNCFTGSHFKREKDEKFTYIENIIAFFLMQPPIDEEETITTTTTTNPVVNEQLVSVAE